MANPLSNLEPKAVFHNFGELCKVPNPSKKEEKIVAYMENWAKERNIAVKKDKTGNLLLSKPATPGMEDRQPVCIQGHIDMVCVAEKGHQIDFDNDPIDVYVDGDWVKAKGTTLGADNLIAIAMGMALLEAKDIPHPPIELLCTLDEEIGLVGANGLGTDLLTSKLLINIDSEDEGVFTVGCAGGLNTIAHYKYHKGDIPRGWLPYEVVVDGLKGGHSGIEINAGRANACKVLTRVLWKATELYDILLSSFDGGQKHNSIPAEACAVVVVSPEREAEFKKFVSEMNEIFKNEFILNEPDANITYEPCDTPERVMTREEQFKLLASFYAAPHGVLRMSPNMKDAKGNPLVQTSTNFAIVETLDDEIKVTTSQRSSVNSERDNIHEKVKAALMLGDAVVETNDGYPAWEPRLVSPLVDLSKEVWKNMYGYEPAIETIHAGLECGIIGDKYEGMDMISIGPNLHDVHSPAERLSISSTKKIWDFVCELMKNIPKITLITLFILLASIGVKAQAPNPPCPPYRTAIVDHPWNYTNNNFDCKVAFEYCCSIDPITGNPTVKIGQVWLPDKNRCYGETIELLRYSGYIPYLVGRILEDYCGVQIPPCNPPDCSGGITIVNLSVLYCFSELYYNPVKFGAPNGWGFDDCNNGPIGECNMTVTICKLPSTTNYSYCIPELHGIKDVHCGKKLVNDSNGNQIEINCYTFCR